jgi:hypothetical protein
LPNETYLAFDVLTELGVDSTIMIDTPTGLKNATRIGSQFMDEDFEIVPGKAYWICLDATNDNLAIDWTPGTKV